MHHGALDRDAVKDITDLFPKCELIVSHGTVHLGGNTPTYYLSTVTGMSGSPVVKGGKVVGNIIPDTDNIPVGVHTGQTGTHSLTNRCVTFSWKGVWKLLERCNVVARECPLTN